MSFSEPINDNPITPHATPTVDAGGRLSYVGGDGRRYLVGLPADVDELAYAELKAVYLRKHVDDALVLLESRDVDGPFTVHVERTHAGPGVDELADNIYVPVQRRLMGRQRAGERKRERGGGLRERVTSQRGARSRGFTGVRVCTL